MNAQLIGYARCSTDEQDLTAQRDRLGELDVAEERIYLDHGLTGTRQARPGLDQALATVLRDQHVAHINPASETRGQAERRYQVDLVGHGQLRIALVGFWDHAPVGRAAAVVADHVRRSGATR